MHLLRSHIIQTTAITALILAMGLSIAAPYSKRVQKTAFVQWVDHHVVTERSGEKDTTFRQHMHRLPQEEESFDLFVMKVSKLIASNLTDMKLPSTENREIPRQLGQWLIKQWSLQQKSMTDQNALLPKLQLPVLKWAVASGPHTGLSALGQSAISTGHSLLPVLDKLVGTGIQTTLTVLAGSISINAP